MSRSYKKTPVCKVSSNYSKKLANRKIRRLIDRNVPIIDGCSYKKFYPQYDICDVWLRRTWNDEVEFMKWLYASPHYWNKSKDTNEDGTPNMKVWFHKWFKFYKMK